MKQSLVDPSPSIHPTAIVGDGVTIGAGTEIGPYAVLSGPLNVGRGCSIGAHCIIGGEPEHRSLTKSGRIIIGDNTVFRESCVVHHGTGQRDTSIGSHCYIMNKAYIAHDSVVGDGVTLSSGVSLGGHVTVQAGANIGLNAAVHQFTTIGCYVMVGMGTPVARDIPPFSLVAGNPMRLRRVNSHQLRSLGIGIENVVMTGDMLSYALEHPVLAHCIDQFLQQSTRPQLFEAIRPISMSRKPR